MAEPSIKRGNFPMSLGFDRDKAVDLMVATIKRDASHLISISTQKRMKMGVLFSSRCMSKVIQHFSILMLDDRQQATISPVRLAGARRGLKATATNLRLVSGLAGASIPNHTFACMSGYIGNPCCESGSNTPSPAYEPTNFLNISQTLCHLNIIVLDQRPQTHLGCSIWISSCAPDAIILSKLPAPLPYLLHII